MAKIQTTKKTEAIRGEIRFSSLSLALFSAVLVVATGLVTSWITRSVKEPLTTNPAPAENVNAGEPRVSAATPPWGDLVTYDIDLEQPDEYVGFELSTNQPPQWMFSGMTRAQTRALMLSSGMATDLVEEAVSPALCEEVEGATVIRPNEQMILALPPKVRANLYAALAKIPGNHYMQFPFCYPGDRFVKSFGNGQNDTRLIALVRKLLYPRGSGLCFSDFELLMQQAKDQQERMDVVKDLSRQSAVLARLRIHPDTDIDKVLGYWARGIQTKDVRPLLESVARMKDGGSISLLYLLPKFARERLYTFPVLGKEGDPVRDCHWSTMNFFNDPPSDEFSNPTKVTAYLNENYYRVAQATEYGDVILVLNKEGNAIHSATYLASDLVFTKNGDNFSQPWMIMRLGDLLARYTSDVPPQTIIYRNKHS
jgi:hypothetical protein